MRILLDNSDKIFAGLILFVLSVSAAGAGETAQTLVCSFFFFFYQTLAVLLSVSGWCPRSGAFCGFCYPG